MNMLRPLTFATMRGTPHLYRSISDLPDVRVAAARAMSGVVNAPHVSRGCFCLIGARGSRHVWVPGWFWVCNAGSKAMFLLYFRPRAPRQVRVLGW